MIPVVIIIILATITNALCDSWIGRKPGISWWLWHIPKWIHFYPPVVGLMIWKIPFFSWPWVWLPLLCWVLWRVVYRRGERYLYRPDSEIWE